MNYDEKTINDLFAQQMAIIANPQGMQAKKLSAEDKKKAANSYLNMYHGLVMNNMLQEQPMGQAMYNAMEHMKSFIATKDANNPTTIYLRQLQASHNIVQSKHMMDPKIKDRKLECPKDLLPEFQKRSNQNVNNGLSGLNAVIAQYNIPEKVDTAQKPAKTPTAAYDNARKQIQMLILMQMHQKQNGMTA